MGRWQTSPLPSKNYCGQPWASQDLSPRWNCKRGSRLFIPAARLSLAIKFCVWKFFFSPVYYSQKKREKGSGRAYWPKGMFCYHLFKLLKEQHQLSWLWMDLLIYKSISASQREREGRSQVELGLRGRSQQEYLEENIRNRVITSLEFELQN